MASFSAALRVAGHMFPVLHCAYGVRQATYQWGRLNTRVRYEPVYLTLDVPAPDDCLGYVPLPALGGPETVEHLEKGKLHEHIALVSQFKGVLER